jgi:hypothetical protein
MVNSRVHFPIRASYRRPSRTRRVPLSPREVSCQHRSFPIFLSLGCMSPGEGVFSAEQGRRSAARVAGARRGSPGRGEGRRGVARVAGVWRGCSAENQGCSAAERGVPRLDDLFRFWRSSFRQQTPGGANPERASGMSYLTPNALGSRLTYRAAPACSDPIAEIKILEIAFEVRHRTFVALDPLLGNDLEELHRYPGRRLPG